MLLLKLYWLFAAPVHIDSNYYLSIGSSFIEHGTLSIHILRLNDTNILGSGGTGYGLLVLMLWFRIFGLSLLSGQMFSYIMGILALIVLYYLVKRWQDERTALFSVVFAVSCGPFFTNFYVRMDSVATLCYLLVLLLWVTAIEQKKIWLHFVVGVAAIATVEIHAIGLLYTAGLSFYYLSTIWQQKRLPTETIAFFIGAFLAGVIYLVIHVLPNIEQYLLVPTRCVSLCLPFGPQRELVRISEFFIHYPIESILFALAVVGAIRRKDYHYLLITLGAIIGLTVLVPWPEVIYTGQLWPLMAIGVGMLLARGIRPGDIVSRLNMQIQFFAFVVLFALQIVRPPYVPVQPIPDNILAYLHRYVPRQTVIMGSAGTYYQLLDYPEFMSYREDDYYVLEIRGEDYLTFWRSEKPLVFIGNPGNDDELLRYFREENFVQALPDLWLSQQLLYF